MAERLSWWRVRRHFIRRSFVRGLEPYVGIFGLASLVVGVTLYAVVGWGFDRPRLGVELAVVLLVLIVLEGAFRLTQDAEQASSEYEERLEPRLTLGFQGGHVNTYASPDGSPGQGKYVTIKVGATRPLQCRAFVNRITTNGLEVPVRAPIPLRWIRESALEVDVYPGLDRELTVVFTQSITPGETFFSTDSFAPTGVPWGLGQGDSVINVVVTARDAPSVEMRLLVHADRDWSKLEVSVDDPGLASSRPSSPPLPTAAPIGMIVGATNPADVPIRDTQDAEEG